MWYWGCSADSRGLGEGAPGVGVEEWHVGPGPPGGTRRCAPRRRQGTPHPPREQVAAF